MPFNPCGYAVEYLREAVADYVRPFRDSDLIVKRKWFRVPDGTPFLPFPTAFYSGQWEPFNWLPRKVGVVYPSDPEYLKPQTLTGFTYDHICGTAEDFAIGAKFDPNFFQEYDEDWIPTCCKRVGMCVFQLCALGQLNDWPFSLLTTYPVTQQASVDTTPALTQQLATNGGNTSPPTAQWTVEFRPGGAINPHGVSVVMSGDTAGEPAFHQVTVRSDDDTALTRSLTSTGWRLDFETLLDTANFRLEWVSRVLTLRGDNLAIDPDLLPPPPPPEPPNALATGDVTAAGSTQGDATPIESLVSHVFAEGDTEGIILPADDQALYFLIVGDASSNPGCALYPPVGWDINGGTTNSSIDLHSSTFYVCKAGGAGSNRWHVFPVAQP